MKKALKIIIGILVIISLFLLGAWYFARKKAVQEQRPAPTFREFIGLGTKKPVSDQEKQGDGSLSSDFTNEDDQTTATDASPATDGVIVSEFTSGPLTPADLPQSGIPLPSPAGGGTIIAGGGSLSQGTALPQTPTLPPGSTQSGAGAACSDTDLEIQFTPEEINRLNQLQLEFYQLAQDLHTDADVAAELANYTTFKAKADQIAELYNYCVAKSPLIGAPAFRSRVATPFWHNEDIDGLGYIDAPTHIGAGSLGGIISSIGALHDPRNLQGARATLQAMFRLNLW